MRYTGLFFAVLISVPVVGSHNTTLQEETKKELREIFHVQCKGISPYGNWKESLDAEKVMADILIRKSLGKVSSEFADEYDRDMYVREITQDATKIFDACQRLLEKKSKKSSRQQSKACVIA